LTIPDKYDQRNISGIKDKVAKTVQNDNFHILFFGSVGSGKTLFSKIITNQIEPYTEKFSFHNASEIYKEYLQATSYNLADRGSLIGKYLNLLKYPNIVLDDLGAEKPATEAAHTYIGGLIENRYNHIKLQTRAYTVIDGKEWFPFSFKTIITTNLSENDILEYYGDRVFSRIQELFTCFSFGNHDFRLKKGK